MGEVEDEVGADDAVKHLLPIKKSPLFLVSHIFSVFLHLSNIAASAPPYTII